jgi:Uncharacterized protein required for cytochrome oxidase assembly
VPTGAVTVTKAWIEMLHRYAATAIGVLVIALVVLALREARRSGGRVGARWAVLTLVWICMQGAFGALTVTLRLYPAIVTLHLLAGFGLLALLAIQAEHYAPRPLAISPRLRAGLFAVAALTVLQVALGGWVSSNYAVLACRDFPTCQGSWWPEMRIAEGFVLLRPLGVSGDAGYLPFAALTAIHMAHRLGALVLLPALAVLAWRCRWRARRRGLGTRLARTGDGGRQRAGSATSCLAGRWRPRSRTRAALPHWWLF